MSAALRLPPPPALPDADAITSAAAELVERAERSERPTTRPPVRLLTTAIRTAMAQLLAVGVIVQLGLGRLQGRTVQRIAVSGNSYPLRAELKRWGFVYRAPQRMWVAYGDVDLGLLLPLLVREHDTHETASQQRGGGK